MRRKVLILLAFIVVVAGAMLASYREALYRAEKMLLKYDASEKCGFVYHGASLAFTPERVLIWRIAYFQREIFTGNPIIIYVSFFGNIVETEPTFISKPEGQQ